MEMRLTQQQKSAIKHDGLLTLSACPGSGKTVVVAHRIKRIIDSSSLKPFQGIAATSFTRIARDSIQASFKQVTGTHAKHPHFIGTLDSFLTQFIFQPFSHRVSTTGKPMTVLDVESNWLTEKIFPQLKAKKLKAENVIYKPDGTYGYTGKCSLQQVELAAIKNHTAKLNVVTQSDINYHALALLRSNENILKAIIRRFPYIIVDEAQDCSDIQMEIINTLVKGGHTQIMLSGDPYQSIYEWRDAKPALYIEKTKDPMWAPLVLNYNQRSGQQICDLLNLFITPGNIQCDPDRTHLADAEVAFINGNEPKQILDDFKASIQRKGIEISEEDVAVLYRGNNSAINTKASINQTSDWWAQTVDKVDMHGLSDNPLKAAHAMSNGRHAEAKRYVHQYFYFQLYRKLVKNYDENKEVFSQIHVTKLLWKFCRKLPNLKQDLSSWLASANFQIIETFNALKLHLNADSTQPILLLKRKRGFAENPQVWEVLSTDDSATRGMLVENIHQIKGRTFKAVLIYIERSNNFAMSAKKLKEVLRAKDMFGHKASEDARCFYVAASRAQRLLCIATIDNDLVDLLGRAKNKLGQ
jgi:DNA helicase II / ATP-dependent DNA helicase PcrA